MEVAQTDLDLAAEDTQVLLNNLHIPVLPERRSCKTFATMIAQIAEEEAYDSEADRTIGDYTMDNEQWLEWKEGGPIPVDEYESSNSDNLSNGTATTTMSWSEATCPKLASIQPSNNRAPARKGPKGKGKRVTDVEDTNVDSSEDDLELEGEYIDHSMSSHIPNFESRELSVLHENN